jgi:CoA:oxalate CoA-transferase
MDTNIQAMSGVMSVTGYEGQPPTTMGFPVGDLAGSYAAVAGIATALYDREKTGKGRMVDISLLDTMISLSGYIGQYSLVSGKACGRLGSGHPTNVPVGAFQTKDGAFVQVQCVTQPLYKALAGLIAGIESKFQGLTTDERFATPTNRLKNRAALEAILKEVFLTRTADEWITKMSSEIAITKVNTVEEALQEPSLLARHMVVEIDHPKAGKHKIIGNPIKVGQDEVHTPAPLVGQHNAEVLGSLLGYNPEQIEALRGKGVI